MNDSTLRAFARSGPARLRDLGTADVDGKDAVAQCLSQIFGPVDDAFLASAMPLLKWVHVRGGEVLLSEGEPPDGVFFVLRGRLGAYVRVDNELRAVGEIGRGETVGEIGVLTGENRTATIVAHRDTVLAHAGRADFERLLQLQPQLPVHMLRIVIERMRRAKKRPAGRRPSTICLLAVTRGVDARRFGEQFAMELARWGSVAVESRDRIVARFGSRADGGGARDSATGHRVAAWLDELEVRHDFVVLVADGGGAWAERCLRQADEVLLVGRADEPAEIHPFERTAFAARSFSPRQTLVLLHDEAVRQPHGTARWLERRPVDAHVHIRPGRQRDVARLARIVSGNAIGLVFAGGGARGFAHLGVYRALEESGIEIDFVGGTSIGAIMAACVSLDRKASEVIPFVRNAFARNPTGDVNLFPLLSLIRGERMRTAMVDAFAELTGSHDADVADSWRTFYCVASNYSTAKEMVITTGPLTRAIRASLSIPVALPPVVWNGELLVDGAVFNNFPTDVMARMGAKRILGVDLSRPSDRRYPFQEMPGTLALLLDQLRPRARRRYRLPSLGSILMRTTILYSESRNGQSRDSVDLYFNPDLRRIGLLEWKSFDRIVEIGYQHAREVLDAMSFEELAPYRDASPAERETPRYPTDAEVYLGAGIR